MQFLVKYKAVYHRRGRAVIPMGSGGGGDLASSTTTAMAVTTAAWELKRPLRFQLRPGVFQSVSCLMLYKPRSFETLSCTLG